MIKIGWVLDIKLYSSIGQTLTAVSAKNQTITSSCQNLPFRVLLVMIRLYLGSYRWLIGACWETHRDLKFCPYYTKSCTQLKNLKDLRVILDTDNDLAELFQNVTFPECGKTAVRLTQHC